MRNALIVDHQICRPNLDQRTPKLQAAMDVALDGFKALSRCHIGDGIDLELKNTKKIIMLLLPALVPEPVPEPKPHFLRLLLTLGRRSIITSSLSFGLDRRMASSSCSSSLDRFRFTPAKGCAQRQMAA